MKNKKTFLIIVLAVVLLAAATYLLWPKNKQGATQSQTEEQKLLNQSILGFNNTGQGVLFDAQSSSIKKLNPATAKLENVLSLQDAKPNYAVMSDDNSALFYTTDSSEDQTAAMGFESENLTIVSLDNSFSNLQEKDIFSPVWLDNKKIAYYLPGNNQGSVVIKDVATGKTTKQITVNAPGSQELNVLDNNHLLINDYSSDVGNISSSIADLTNGRVAPYITGLGLKFKTVVESKYLAYQTLENDQAVTKIIEWQNKNKLLEMQETVDNFDWLKTDKEIIYGTRGLLYRFDVASTKSVAQNKKYTEPLLAIKILSDNKLFLRTEEKTEIIDLGNL